MDPAATAKIPNTGIAAGDTEDDKVAGLVRALQDAVVKAGESVENKLPESERAGRELKHSRDGTIVGNIADLETEKATTQNWRRSCYSTVIRI